jgi:beta-N-acetylhexosaminidase
MFVSIDHEGGRVIRPPLPITRFPYASLYHNLAREVGLAIGLELKSLGINVCWAPVADVYSNPLNPIIGPRAFGLTPETAAQNAVNFYEGLKEARIIGCAKHFPGHGDTSKDSHIELPVLNLGAEELANRELIPFKALINAQIPSIMTAHILFPQIDADVPATLSKQILTGILREQLGFRGVVVSDDLDMKAVSEMFVQSGTVAKSLHAGCDLFIVSRNIGSISTERTYAMAKDFAESLKNGSLDESVVEIAQTRIDELLAVTPQHQTCQIDQATLKKHGELAIACTLQKVKVPEIPTQRALNKM